MGRERIHVSHDYKRFDFVGVNHLRLILESLLGLRLEVDKLRLAPCLPADWQQFKLHYRYRETVYHITVTQPRDAGSAKGVTVDGVPQDDTAIPLVDDHQEHTVEVSA